MGKESESGDAERTQAELRAAQDKLADVIAALPAPLRHAVVLRYVKRIPPQDGARHLCISKEEFQNRLAQALSLCRVKLQAAGVDALQFAPPLEIGQLLAVHQSPRR